MAALTCGDVDMRHCFEGLHTFLGASKGLASLDLCLEGYERY